MRSFAAYASRGVLFPLAHCNIRSAKDEVAMAIHPHLRTGIH
ncbi:hypothetical protein CES85_0059 [Ochrobactrum quorumnocens]|uniref:Uncharacterized protein n=1 Tax=Ochrobactrum quorumnocens TaxID=271865 RepID=A0A248UHV4_9HYPH|nr:hypothetical protein CES85_0059 [[Ochrobactrum] quorumnocens]TCQ81959.1 hypothetical protein EDF68_101341 [Ochrobactrum sp. BH3]